MKRSESVRTNVLPISSYHISSLLKQESELEITTYP